ncbi:PREDICTED: uncharacterized protein LOC104803183 [Tarenaya hassleriana]|uniref:uncharacterized protein LOC104803183 n=1 Tax=Tarenaya hassleriana TaxID=28532 RepID=UPI0008FD2778|nr:PREDICTED: uncharacterized protein LOC104803183 [Tarenaya hassleriana]
MRVLMLLEYFRELYVREIQLLKKIFPGVKDEFLDFFKKIGEAVSQAKQSRERVEFRTIERSLSVGSPRLASRGFDFGSEIPTGNERFKVSTVNSGGAIDGDGQTKK